jgi:F0F1-type ATP synthase membrane subunit c/vacuolar-type H+-ATPase subunit K
VNPALSVALQVVVVAVLGVVAVLAGSPVVSAIFRRADPPRPPTTTSEQAAAADQTDAPGIRAAAATLRGGRWIGMLERLAVFATILAGFGEGIAVVLAIKALARYPELKATSSGAAERFIIGTFTSVLFAAACAGLAWWLIGLW